MTKDRKSYEVIIVGGGPAGIATALTLTARGVSNCIVEARREPTRKLGEAIPPNAKPLLKKLGLIHLLDAAEHITYYGNKSCWGSNEMEQKEFIRGIHGHGYLLDRLHFEKQLRGHLQSQGGLLMAGSKLKKVRYTQHGIEADIENGKVTTTLQAAYIVDATGRKASVCRQLGVARRKLDTQFAMVCTAELANPMEHQIFVEATENGWWYVAPQSNTELTLMFFTLKELLPFKKDMECYLRKELAATLHLSKVANTANLNFNAVRVMPAGTSRLDVLCGDHWIAVGDAAITFDPISSYGITSALASGYYAGHALADHLLNKNKSMLAYRYVMESAFQAYTDKLAEQYARESRWEGSKYWNQRFLVVNKPYNAHFESV